MSEKNIPPLDWRVVFNRATPPGLRKWGRVRAAQLVAIGPALRIAAWGQGIGALYVAFLLADAVPPLALGAWVLGITLATGLAIHRQAQVRGRQIHSVGRGTIDRAAYHALVFALLWGVPARYFFDLAQQPQQLALCVLSAIMMAGATFVFAPVPAAAAVFLVILGVGVGHMLMSTGSLIIALVAPLYAFAMLGFVFTNGRAFMQRTWLDLELEQRQRTVSLLLREYENSDGDWLWRTNGHLAFEGVSARFARTIGATPESLEGMSLRDLTRRARVADRESRRTLAALGAAIARREAFSDVKVQIQVGDELRTIRLSARPCFGPSGRFQGYEGVGSDVTLADQAAARIHHMAHYDGLTGLPNRAHLLQNLANALDAAQARGERCALILIDLNRFKTINDTLGHMAGDAVLEQVARALDHLIPDEMTAGRLGGDEFAVVVPQAECRNDLEQTCLAMISALRGPFSYREQRLFVGASLGVAVGPRDGQDVETLMRNADLALYKAKGGAGEQICFYDASLHASNDERRRIEQALRGALEARELSLLYQPVVNAETSRIEAFEALLRWTSAELGPVPPAKFIPIAEETGMLGKIGEWVLRTASREAMNWPEDITLAVNISPRQLQDQSFLITLVSALTQSQLPPGRLELEVTEGLFLELSGKTQRILEQIQSLGVKLAMDDFGTGYSSLGYLRKAQFDTLKIDQSFVQAIHSDDPESIAIIRAVVAMAETLGMKTVAEGVSNEEQLRLVKALGCDRIQGYIFSRPVAADTARAMLGTGAESRAA